MARVLDEFFPGDVVRIRGSATKMTVRRVDTETGEIITHWFNDADELQEYPFAPEQLQMVKKASEV